MKKYEVYVQNTKEGLLEHDYDLLKLKDKLSLSDSTGKQWSKSSRGEVMATLEDTGNDVIIQLEGKKKPIVLDYKQAAELQMLLLANLESDYVTEIREAKSLIRYSGLTE